MKLLRKTGTALLLFSPLGFVACSDGPVEEAGEQVDDAAEEAGDAVDDALDSVEDAAD